MCTTSASSASRLIAKANLGPNMAKRQAHYQQGAQIRMRKPIETYKGCLLELAAILLLVAEGDAARCLLALRSLKP